MLKGNFFILVFSILISLMLSVALSYIHFVPDGDLLNGPIVWREVKEHGISVLSQWNPTVDNWYFSAYPMNFLMYSIFGMYSKWGIIAAQTTQLLAISIVSALIVKSMSSGSKLSWLVMPIICAFGAYTWRHGLIAHPFSHNITNLYGLACCYLFIKNLNRNSYLFDFGIFFLTLLASISDPWFLASYYLPILIAYGYCTIISRSKRFLSLVIIIVAGLILFSHIIENYLGLPVARFKIGSFDNWLYNAKWVVTGIGAMFNLFFVEGSSDKYAPFYSISFIIVTALLLYCVSKKRHFNVVDLLFAMSICGIISSFIISDIEWKYYSARFLINVVFIIVIYLFSFAITNKSKVIYSFFMVLFCSGIYSHVNSMISKSDPTALRVLRFMKSNNLNYGYGSYWATGSIAVNWLSRNEYVIRPVTFDPKHGFMNYPGRAQTFNFWYSPDEGKGHERQFIAISDGVNSEGCKNKALCKSAVIKQFGNPDETLNMGNMLFLVFNRNILAKQSPSIEGRGVLRFGYNNDQYNRFHWSGWTRPGANDMWSEGEESEMIFSLPESFTESEITISGDSRQKITLTIKLLASNDQVINIHPGKFKKSFHITKNDTKNGIAKVSITLDGVISPKDMGLNSDERKLGIDLKEISYDTK